MASKTNEITLKISTNSGYLVGDYVNCGENYPLVVITHGRGGNRNSFSKKIADYLSRFNISSLRIDLYGYGESSGKFEDITISTAKKSVLDAVSFIKSNLKYKDLFLFGTSYGGSGILAALDSLSESDISGLILRSTLLDYFAKTLRENSKKQLEDWKSVGYINDSEGKLNYSFVEDMKNYRHIDYDKLSKFKTIYFHAGKDTKVLGSEVENLKSQVGSNIKIIIYPESKHGVDQEKDRKDMLLKTKEFVLENSK